MIIRIVKMQFHPEHTAAFQHLFSENQYRIEGFEGCLKVDLLQDIDSPTIFFTYSHWEDIEALERYRQSDVFKSIWSKTKVLFNEAPMAWSVKSV